MYESSDCTNLQFTNNLDKAQLSPQLCFKILPHILLKLGLIQWSEIFESHSEIRKLKRLSFTNRKDFN